jgi:hypothetical protein
MAITEMASRLANAAAVNIRVYFAASGESLNTVRHRVRT